MLKRSANLFIFITIPFNLNAMTKKDDIILYQGKDGAIELREDFHAETIWARLDQIASLFERDKSVISRHLSKIFSEDELHRE